MYKGLNRCILCLTNTDSTSYSESDSEPQFRRNHDNETNRWDKYVDYFID